MDETKWHKGKPTKDGEYLCAVDWDGDGQFALALAIWKKGRWLGWRRGAYSDLIVWWMPVPPLPKGEGNG